MSASRSLFVLLWVAAICSGCGQKVLHFQSDQCINMGLLIGPEHLTELNFEKDTVGKDIIKKIKKVYVYEAILMEMLVEQNQITDFGLVNEASSQSVIDRHVNGFSNKLYFFTFDLDPRQHRVAILMSTSFAREKCVGIGPIYMGSISDGDSLKRSVFRVLKLLKATYIEKDNIYVLNNTKEKPDTRLQFSMDKALLPITASDSITRTSPFNIVRLIQSSDNKISGPDKQVVYNIGPLFDDPDALKFTFFKSFE